MKKNEKIIIGILVLITLVMIAVLVFTKIENFNKGENLSNQAVEGKTDVNR